VAVIAFRVDDAAAAYAESVAAGAAALQEPRVHERDGERVVTAMVSGSATWRTAWSSAADQGEFLPGALEMADAPVQAGRSCCAPSTTPRSASRTATWSPRCATTARPSLRADLRGVRRGRRAGDVLAGGAEPVRRGDLHLIQPDVSRHRGQIDDFLSWHGGPGVQHLALSTDDIAGPWTRSARAAPGSPPPPAPTTTTWAGGWADRHPVERLSSRGILADRDHWA